MKLNLSVLLKSNKLLSKEKAECLIKDLSSLSDGTLNKLMLSFNNVDEVSDEFIVPLVKFINSNKNVIRVCEANSNIRETINKAA